MRATPTTPHFSSHSTNRPRRVARMAVTLTLGVLVICWVLAASATASSATTTAFTPYGNVVSISPTPDSEGYVTITTEGKVSAYGDAAFGSGQGGPGPMVAIVQSDNPWMGFWMASADGGVFSIGVPFYGSMGGRPLDAPIVGMVTTPDNLGYWLVAADGGVFSYGAAPFLGSMGGKRLNAPISGIAATKDGRGYWLVGEDNGVFAFGDAGFFGPTFSP